MYRVNAERSQVKNDRNGLIQRCTKVIMIKFFEEKKSRHRDAVSGSIVCRLVDGCWYFVARKNSERLATGKDNKLRKLRAGGPNLIAGERHL